MNNSSDTNLHSKAHRGGDEEPTEAYTEVRRGARRGDNEGESKKATWYEIDAIDRTILNTIQEEFPLTEKPFEVIGRQAGISGEGALGRIRRLTKEGYIRRIGLVLERKKLGYAGLLCGAHVDAENIEAIAGEINKEPGVTHNYEREGELNLWFTVTMKTTDDIDKFITTLEKTFPIKVYKFPEKRTFKIKTFFPV